MSTLSDLWAGEVASNPRYKNYPVPFQTPMDPSFQNPDLNKKTLFNQNNQQTQQYETPKEYINPTTGKKYTAQEIVDNMKKKLIISKPENIGDVPQYTADQFRQGEQSGEDLVRTATNLNNAANDIATGTTDPYDITKGGTIVYSPQEKEAIRKAYAGVYDPAITTALYKLDQKQKQDAAAEEEATWKERQKFSTEENIRQYNATTGAGGGSGIHQFTQSQLNEGATNAGLTRVEFDALNNDLKNYLINNNAYKSALKEVLDGEITAAELAQEIIDSTAPDYVKEFFIKKLPLTQTEKDSWLKKAYEMAKSLIL